MDAVAENMDAFEQCIPTLGQTDKLLKAESNQEQVESNFKTLFAPEFVPRSSKTDIQLFPRYGRKVFVGGIQKGIGADELQANFAQFGIVSVDWPYRIYGDNCPPSGYAFIIYNDASSVNKLVEMCAHADNKMMIGITTMMGAKHVVEIKPWDSKNNECIVMSDWQKFTRFTVFIGGLPRTITAAELADSLQDAVGNVAHVCIEIEDKTDYPKGAGRAVFSQQESYIRAIAIKQITVVSFGSEKNAEIKPYIFTKMKCEYCTTFPSSSFCPEVSCLKYFCDNCWRIKHCKAGMIQHKPMQKGRYLKMPTNFLVPVQENLRMGMSSSQPHWMPATQSSLGSLTPGPSTSNGSFFGNSLSDVLRFHNSYGSLGYSSASAEASPAFTGMSTESVFDFTKH